MGRSLVAGALCVAILAGCSSMSLEYRNTGGAKSPESAEHAPGQTKKHASLKVPPGHLPPPGSCRIWIPGTPPGKQPRAGECSALARNVPAGAWLLHRPASDPRSVDVSVYDKDRPSVLVEVRVYDAETGAFIRVRGER